MVVPVDSVEVAIQNHVAYAKVHGRGTFKVAPGLKQFGTASVEQGCQRLVLEMEDCRGMDSTFMGVLAGLAVQLKKKDGEVVLRHLSEKNCFLVKILGLSHLIRVEEAGAQPSAMPSGTRVLDAGADKQVLTKTMITAHEVLVEIAPDNMVKFKDVLAFLKEDLQRVDERAGAEKLP